MQEVQGGNSSHLCLRAKLTGLKEEWRREGSSSCYLLAGRTGERFLGAIAISSSVCGTDGKGLLVQSLWDGIVLSLQQSILLQLSVNYLMVQELVVPHITLPNAPRVEVQELVCTCILTYTI